MKNNTIYIHFDGDGIGDRLELFLLDDEIDEAKKLSENVNQAMKEISAAIESIDGAQVLLVGGDDLIALFSDGSLDLKKIEELRERFLNKTGCTLSTGIGTSLQSALNNLRRAKLSGKNRIVGEG